MADEAVDLADQRVVGREAGFQARERAGEARVVAMEPAGHPAHRDAPEAAADVSGETSRERDLASSTGSGESAGADPGLVRDGLQDAVLGQAEDRWIELPGGGESLDCERFVARRRPGRWRAARRWPPGRRPAPRIALRRRGGSGRARPASRRHRAISGRARGAGDGRSTRDSREARRVIPARTGF